MTDLRYPIGKFHYDGPLSEEQMRSSLDDIARTPENLRAAVKGLSEAQIDTPYLTETTCGLTYVVNRFHGWPHSGHITLVRGERSRLADFASEAL